MNSKKITIILAILIILLVCLSLIFLINKDVNTSVNENSNTVTYINNDYGFKYDLPINWQGYSIVNDKWIGTSLMTGTTTQTGAKISIRNPKWSAAAPHEDLPILIFTITQWNSYLAQEYAIGAAPIQASELGRNNKFVFALPARWDFDYSLDFKEAQGIVAGNPLRPFDIEL